MTECLCHACWVISLRGSTGAPVPHLPPNTHTLHLYACGDWQAVTEQTCPYTQPGLAWLSTAACWAEHLSFPFIFYRRKLFILLHQGFHKEEAKFAVTAKVLWSELKNWYIPNSLVWSQERSVRGQVGMADQQTGARVGSDGLSHRCSAPNPLHQTWAHTQNPHSHTYT